MKRFVPNAKLSKKKKQDLNKRKRGSWGGLNPVTRKAENPKAYKRSKARSWKEDDPRQPACFEFLSERICAVWTGERARTVIAPG